MLLKSIGWCPDSCPYRQSQQMLVRKEKEHVEERAEWKGKGKKANQDYPVALKLQSFWNLFDQGK